MLYFTKKKKKSLLQNHICCELRHSLLNMWKKLLEWHRVVAETSPRGFVRHFAEQKGQELFLLDCSHVRMQSLWMVWEQLSGWRLSGSTWFWHIRQSLRAPKACPPPAAAAALCGGGVGRWMGPGGTGRLMGPGADLSLCASLKPTCSMTSSMDMPARVPRELFTCWSSDIS